MRRAELLMAVALGGFSLYLMRKSAELPIGWIIGEGPGGGAFPFWLSVGMLLSALWVVGRWFKGTGPFAQASEAYMNPQTFKLFVIGAGSLTAMIGAIHFIGVYGAIPLFLVFYMHFLGRHAWLTTMLIALGTPIVTFLFFEITLKIPLPKGLTEPLFYPLYNLFY